MYGSIVPWNGMVEDRSFQYYHGGNSDGLVALQHSLSVYPTNCVIDTRNDTWFSLDTIVYEDESAGYSHPPEKQSLSDDFSRILHEMENKRENEVRIQQPTFPILPSYFDIREDDLDLHTSENESSLAHQGYPISFF